MSWNILLIEPQREFAAAAGLVGYGFTAYLPTIKRTIRRGSERRRITVDRPLFPGYIFLKSPNASQSLVHAVRGVRGYLKSGEGLAALSEAAIATVRHVEEEALAASNVVPASHVKVGDHVRIKPDHNWCGKIHGMLKRLDKSDRATIEVMLPSRAVEIITTVDWLEVV